MSVARQYPTSSGVTGTGGMRLVPAEGVGATRPAMPFSILFLGIVAVLVAAWGAAAPFAGPEFGFVADRASAWTWSVTSACLGLGPGAVAFLAALVVVGAATRRSYARRADLWVLGFITALCGAWFVVGQYVWPVIYGRIYIAPSTVTHFMWKELAFSIGPGVILVCCGAVFMGWAIRRQLALVAEHTAVAGTPAVAGTGVRTGVTTMPATTARPTGTMAPPPPEPTVVERPAEPRTAGTAGATTGI